MADLRKISGYVGLGTIVFSLGIAVGMTVSANRKSTVPTDAQHVPLNSTPTASRAGNSRPVPKDAQSVPLNSAPTKLFVYRLDEARVKERAPQALRAVKEFKALNGRGELIGRHITSFGHLLMPNDCSSGISLTTEELMVNWNASPVTKGGDTYAILRFSVQTWKVIDATVVDGAM